MLETRALLSCCPQHIHAAFLSPPLWPSLGWIVLPHAALEVIPYTLAENAGMNPISIVTELRSEHAKGKVGAGEKASVVGWMISWTCCLDAVLMQGQ